MTENENSTRSASDETQKSAKTGLPEPSITEEQLAIINQAEQAFEEMCARRHIMGQTKYGVFTFIEMPTIEMAMEEVADLANYARYTFIKLAMIRDSIKKTQQQTLRATNGSFYTTADIYGVAKEVQ